MAANSAAACKSAPPCDDQAVGKGVVAASPKKSTQARRAQHDDDVQSRHVPRDQDIHEAILWRLGSWSTDAIEAATARIGRLIERGIPIDEDQPEIAKALTRFDRDRRDPWTALCAIAALYADSRGMERLFLVAGFEVLRGYAQSKRGRAHRGDALSDRIRGLAHRADATAGAIFNALADTAGPLDVVIVDYDAAAEVLVYEPKPGARLKEIDQPTLARRVRRIKNGR